MPKTNALIFGHSHVWSMNRAVESLRKSTPDDVAMRVLLCGTQKFPGTLLCKSSKDAEYINPALVSVLSDFPAKADANQQQVLISMVQGNYYNIVGMLYEGRPFDFVLPTGTALPFDHEQAELVPYDAVKAQMGKLLYELPTFYKKLKNLGYQHIVHVGVPPPHPSSDFIRAELTRDPKFANKPVLVSPPFVRLKLWMVQEELLRDLCEKEQVNYLSAPQAARSESGFLDETYAKDIVHGNQAYAELVHQQIIDLIQQKFR